MYEEIYKAFYFSKQGTSKQSFKTKCFGRNINFIKNKNATTGFELESKAWKLLS